MIRHAYSIRPRIRFFPEAKQFKRPPAGDVKDGACRPQGRKILDGPEDGRMLNIRREKPGAYLPLLMQLIFTTSGLRI
jgi:hypothetical protein